MGSKISTVSHISGDKLGNSNALFFFFFHGANATEMKLVI